MEKHTQLKKFKCSFVNLILITLGFVLIEQNLIANDKIPVLHHLGVIPVQWQSKIDRSYQEEQLLKNLNISFPSSIRSAQRFRVLNDNLIKSFWKTPTGRDELKNDYELSAYGSLTVVPTSDTYVLIARVLDPYFEILLQESKTVLKKNIVNKSYDKIEKHTQDLIYKLFNRLPIDASITSIQGRYITISAGIAQGLHVGNKITVVRSKVATRHPANKSWLSFNTKVLGEATIVDIKKQTGVAQISQLTQEDAISVGDGIKIINLASRTNFARQKRNLPRLASNDTIIVPPLYDGKKKINTSSPPIQPKNEDGTSTQITPTVEQKIEQNTEEKPNKIQEKPKSTEIVEEKSNEEDSSINIEMPIGLDDVKNAVSYIAEEMTFKLGQKWWWYNGPGSTGAVMRWYLPVNEIGGELKRKIFGDFKYNIGGSLGLGGGHGNVDFTAYDSHIKVYMERPMNGIPEIKNWRVGGVGHFTGMAVNNSSFGGYDYITGGIFAGAEGVLRVDTFNIDWFGDFTLTPLTFGRIGYKGSRKTIKSSFGWDLNVGGFMSKHPQVLEYGASFSIGGHDVSDSKSTETGIKTFSIHGLARYRF